VSETVGMDRTQSHRWPPILAESTLGAQLPSRRHLSATSASAARAASPPLSASSTRARIRTWASLSTVMIQAAPRAQRQT
jgi:hypothetical protein